MTCTPITCEDLLAPHMGTVAYVSGKDAECNDVYEKPQTLICSAFASATITQHGVPNQSVFIDPTDCSAKILPDITKISTYSVASIDATKTNSVQILPNGDVYFIDSFGVSTRIEHKCCLDVLPGVLPSLDTSLHETVQLLADGTKWIVDDTGDAMQINSVVVDNVTIVGNGTSASPLVAKIPVITSGMGLPPNTTGSPVVWTDLSTGDVYYRDITGAVTRIEHPLSCEEVQDCLATAFPFTTYDDAGNRFIFTPGVNGQVWTTAGGIAQWVSLPANVPLTVIDTASVNLTNSGIDGHTIQADVKVSTTAGNQVSINPDGLYVATPTAVSVQDSSTIDFSTPATNVVTGSVKVDPANGNLIQVTANGLRIDCASIDDCQTDLTPVDTNTVNLTTSGVHGHVIQADVVVSPAVGNTLQNTPAGLYVAPDIPLTVIDTASVDLTSSGTLSHTVQADVRVSPDAGNSLSIHANGLYVTAPTIPAQTPLMVVDTQSVNLTSSGVDGHTVQADVVVSGVAGNALQSTINGLYVPTVTQTPLMVVDTATVNLTSSGVDNHTVQADVKISASAGNQVVANADGIYVPMAAVVNVCSSLQAFPNGGTLAAGDMVVVPGSGANACQLKSFPAIAGDNWGSQTVQHDGTLSGNGTAASPLAVIPCAVVQGVADSVISVQTGDKIIVKTAGGCEARPMPAAAAMLNDCTLVNNAGTLGVNSSALLVGSTLDLASAASPLRDWQLVNGSIANNSPISQTVSATIANTSTCRSAKIKIDIDYGYWGFQIDTVQGTVIAAGFEVNVGSGWKRVSTHEGDESKDIQSGTDKSDMGMDGTSASFVQTIPAGSSLTVQARVVKLGDATGIYYSEIPIISWIGMAI